MDEVRANDDSQPPPAIKPGYKAMGAALKKVSESTRERETFKYDPFLLSNTQRVDQPGAKSSNDLLTSGDTILTALAQLGACQTSTSRSLISLFDQDHQYIVAEATPTLPLVANLDHAGRNSEVLWLCGTHIPRSHGVCEFTLLEKDGDPEGPSDPGSLPLLLVPDLASDPRFRSKPYSKSGSFARFYAAVPIRSHRGINIGVYCVLDPEPDMPWDQRKTEQMSNISQSIMEYLEARRHMSNHQRSIRMNRGIGSFMEGKSTVAGSSFDQHATQPRDAHEGKLNENQQLLQRNKDHAAEQQAIGAYRDQWSPAHSAVVGGDRTDRGLVNDNIPGTAPNPHVTPADLARTAQDIFSKAANIIRESIEVEGCLWLDAQVQSFGGLSAPSKDHRSPGSSPRSSSQSSSSEDHSHSVAQEAALSKSPTLGFSTSSTSSIDGANLSNLDSSMTEKVLSKLLQRYPRGKIFNFDVNGELQSSESSEDDLKTQEGLGLHHHGATPLAPSHSPASKRHDKPWAKHREGSTILETFPGARSVAFVPVWDSRKERWIAGGFVYTRSPTRIFTIEGELSFLRAFGLLAVANIASLETALSNKTKSDVLGSISHEIRSPLHGVILGVELLHDTELSVFQGNLVHTIETCGRTLTDTLDHLLDYSKLNSYMKVVKSRDQRRGLTRGLRFGRSNSVEAGMKSLSSDVGIDRLTEEVIESVFAGFNFQYGSVAQQQRISRNHSDTLANRRMDSMNAMEELGSRLAKGGDLQFELGKVTIFLDIDPTCSWLFHTQGGAIRRILMNLFGNSLKYTRKGTIEVSLRQYPSGRRTRSNERIVNIKVTDTGKGIGEDYLRNEIFKPFHQEDQLAPGTGLGLSIVKKVVSQLGGSISVDSRINEGTTISVSLPMAQASLPSPPVESTEDKDFKQQISDLARLRVRLIGLDEEGLDQSRVTYGHATSVCRDWLHMEVLADSLPAAVQKNPDLLLVSEKVITEAEGLPPGVTPAVVVCANALVAHALAVSSKAKGGEGIVEFISQPIGPRKLAKVLLIAFKRWVDYQAQHVMTPIHTNKDPFQSSEGGQGPATSDAHTSDTTLRQGSTTPEQGSSTELVAASLAPDQNLPAPEPTWGFGYFMLVDDNYINLRVLSTYVRKLGQAFHTASNGQQALDAYVAGPDRYRCIFMDISMPVMDGFEAARRIRSHERENHLPPVIIFALSGLASIEAQQEAFGSGIDLFLSKPVTLKELGSILKSKGLV